MTPDIINGVFEFIGALLIANNSRVLLQDKEVKGFHWTTTTFFTSWGLWNLFYYPNLDQWFSFAGGVAIVLANAVWLSLTLYYLKIFVPGQEVRLGWGTCIHGDSYDDCPDCRH